MGVVDVEPSVEAKDLQQAEPVNCEVHNSKLLRCGVGADEES